MTKIFYAILCLILIFFLFPGSTSAAEPPTLQSPSSGSTTSDTSPTLNWNWLGACPLSGSCFRVQVDNQSDFSGPEKDYYTSNTDYSPQLSDGSWYWRVKAKEAESWSDWSSVWNFVIGQEILSATPAPQSPTPTASSQTGQISLSEFLPNPQEGNEWVELFNPTSSSIDISGYKIDDIEGGSSPFTIPDGTVLAGQNYLYFSFSSRLNNDGDTARLINSEGQVLEEYPYSQSTKGVALAKDSQGSWQETTTPTPGQANIITKPQVEGTTTGGKTSQSTSKKTTTEKPTSTPKSSSEVKSATSREGGAVLSTSTEEAVLPQATVTAAEEATEESKVLSSKGSLLPAILFVAAGVVLLLGIGAKIAKSKKKK